MRVFLPGVSAGQKEGKTRKKSKNDHGNEADDSDGGRGERKGDDTSERRLDDREDDDENDMRLGLGRMRLVWESAFPCTTMIFPHLFRTSAPVSSCCINLCYVSCVCECLFDDVYDVRVTASKYIDREKEV